MRRIFNYRPVVIFCLFVISSILIAFAMQRSAWYAFLLLLPISGVIALLYHRKSLKVLYYLIAICVGFSSCSLTFAFYNKDVDGKYYISGRVSEVSIQEEYTLVYINGTKAEDINTGDTVKLPGKTAIYLYDGDSFNVGDNLTLLAKVKPSVLYKDNGVNTFVYRNNVKYYASAYNIVESTQGKLSLSEMIKKKSRSLMQDNLSSEVAGVTYAVLFGDRTMIDDNVNNAFKDSGTVHLLAVSGLHVGFLIALLYLFFSLIRLKKWYKFGAMAIVLACYSYICGFSPSVLRASIMGLVILLADNLGREKDRLSSVALSAVLILTFRPLYLFDYGFLLSYGAVLGILLIARPLTQLCGKNIVTKVIVGAVAVCICAQLGVLPITMSMGELPTYSLIANIIVVPLFGIAYMLLCIINLIVLIMPFMKFLYVLIEGLFGGVITINAFVSNLPGAVVKVFSFGILASIIFYILIFFISKYTMLRTKLKVSVCCILACICVTMVVGSNLPARFDYNNISFIRNSSICTVVSTTDNEVYLVDLPSTYKESQKIEEYLRANRIRLSGIIALHNTSTQTGYVRNILAYNKGKIYLPDGHNLLASMDSEGYKFEILEPMQDYDIGSLTIKYIANQQYVATSIAIENKNMLYLSTDEKLSVDLVKLTVPNVDYLIAQQLTDKVEDVYDCQYILKKDNGQHKALDIDSTLSIRI